MTYAARLHDTCIGAEGLPGNPCRCCCAACLEGFCALHNPDHDACLKPSRYWWYTKDQIDVPWWKWAWLASDEFCNRTVVLRLYFRYLVFSLRFPLRQETCEECLSLLHPFDS